MDATYKCNVNNYTLLNILAIHNNGKGCPVFHAFLQAETADIIAFNNSEWPVDVVIQRYYWPKGSDCIGS